MELITGFNNILEEISELIVDLDKGDCLDIKLDLSFSKDNVFSLIITVGNFNHFRFALNKDFEYLTKRFDNCMFFEDFRRLRIAILYFIKKYEY